MSSVDLVGAGLAVWIVAESGRIVGGPSFLPFELTFFQLLFLKVVWPPETPDLWN